MNLSPDEAREARIQKYKEERRKQLTAKTATLFSANVTERRPRKPADRAPLDDNSSPLKSSSEIVLNTASTSVPIRTTRASRLRAAASYHSDSAPQPRKSRSSSVQCLVEDNKPKTNKTSKIIDRDKGTSATKSKRLSAEKENFKSASATCVTEKDIGAIKLKSKHSTIKNILEKDKSKNLVKNARAKSVDQKESNTSTNKRKSHRKSSSVEPKTENRTKKVIPINDAFIIADPIEALSHKSVNNLDKDKLKALVSDLATSEESVHSSSTINGVNVENNLVNSVEVLNDSDNNVNITTIVVNEGFELESVVPKESPELDLEKGPKVNDPSAKSLLGAVCVQKVNRFSELLNNLCSPCELDVLYKAVLLENGLVEENNERKSVPECSSPCRRVQPTTSRTTSTPKKNTAVPTLANDVNGIAAKSKNRRPIETTPPKTESSLPSSRISPKNNFNLNFGSKSSPQKPSSSLHKSYERRRSSEHGSKPSCIPIKNPTEKVSSSADTPSKTDSGNHRPVKTERNTQLIKEKSPRKSIDKSKNNENHRIEKDNRSASEKYHNSKTRLTSLENSTAANVAVKSSQDSAVSSSSDLFHKDKNIVNDNLENNTDSTSMFTVHEPLRPHPSRSRLSQEMDSLAAFTKQTLDRVNKLSCNLTSNKANKNLVEPPFDSILPSSGEDKSNRAFNYGLDDDKNSLNRGVDERLKDIDTAAQRLIDFEKQNSMFSDLSNLSSQNRRQDSAISNSHTPVSILKRKSIHEEMTPSLPSHAIASPPVTFSPSVEEISRTDNRQRQGILKKRRSLDESQVARRRSCSPEVSFADDGSSEINKPILKNRRSSLEDIMRNRSPDGQIQGILKRKMSKEEDPTNEDVSYDSPEPHGILKRKSNSSSSSSTTSSHVSIAQAVLLAAAGGAEIVDDDKETVRPILKKKSFSEDRPSPDILPSETPRPILKKKSTENDDYDYERPKKPILKSSRKVSGDDGHTSSFDLSEDDRSSRRSSLLRTRTSDHSGSECEATVRPILKQRGSSLTRERSQSPRPRLSFCADNDPNISVTNFSCDSNELSSGTRPGLPFDSGEISSSFFPSTVLLRRNLRPKNSQRSKSLVCDVNNELLSILSDRRSKVEQNCNGFNEPSSPACRDNIIDDDSPKSFPSIAARIKSMEKALGKDLGANLPSSSKGKFRDRDRFKTQPITVEEMRSVTSSLEPGQASFQTFGPTACSFPSRPDESSASRINGAPYGSACERDPFADFENILDSPPYDRNPINNIISPTSFNGLPDSTVARKDSFGEATFLDFENIDDNGERRQSTLDEIEQEVNKVRVALDEDCRALEEDERQQADGDNWSLNVSCDSGYNRASSRDSGPHSGEELGLLESHDIKENHTTNSSSNEWSSSSLERNLVTMDRARKSTENETYRNETMGTPDDQGSDEERTGFNLGLVKSNSVVARASMWQQLQQQAKGTPKPLLRHSRSKAKDGSSMADRFKTQPISFTPVETRAESPTPFSLSQSKSTANVLDKDDDDLDNYSPTDRAERMITPEVRGILKSGTTVLPSKPNPLVKGESSEGLKDEGIESSSDDESASASSVSSSEKSCTSSDSSDELPDPKPRRFQRKNNKLKSSRTDSDITRLQDPQKQQILTTVQPLPMKIQPLPTKIQPLPTKIQQLPTKLQQSPTKIQQFPTRVGTLLPGANEMKERLAQARNPDVKVQLGKLRRPSEIDKEENDKNAKYRRFAKKLDEPIQLAKLKRPTDKVLQPIDPSPPPMMKISVLNQEAKNKFFGLNKGDRSIEELTAAVSKYIPPVNKSMSTHTMEVGGSGSDGESSGGREVRRINCRGRHRLGGGVQRSATHAEMPHKGGTIAERLAALQQAGANDWRARVCRISPEREDSKAIERVKNKINENLNSVDEKKKVQIEENEVGSNILADRRNKLETAAQGWRKRVPQNDASLFTVAGRLERDKVTPPATPPPTQLTHNATLPSTPQLPASPGVPSLNKFRSRKNQSPTNGFANGPLRSASCAVVNTAIEVKTKEVVKEKESTFKRSQSVNDSFSNLDDKSDKNVERTEVRVPRADDETFQAFFTPVLQTGETVASSGLDLDLDAIDSGSRQLLAGEWAKRAKRSRKHVASRNPLRALAARTDIKEEYSEQIQVKQQSVFKIEKSATNIGLAAEALAALATKEDFSNVALKSASATNIPAHGTKPLMLMQVKGRRKVQTRLVEPQASNVNRGDCFVLAASDRVFLYIGHYANVIERNRSTDIATHIHNTKDLGCKNSTGIVKIDEQLKNYTTKQWVSFWSTLGVKDDIENYKPVETGSPEEDEVYETCVVQTNMCYEVMDDELVPIKEYWGQMPKIAMLHQSKTLVFDYGSEMYIWYGKNVPLECRRKAAQLAQELFDEGYNYEECHINPLNAATYHGAREICNQPPKTSKTRPDWAIFSKVTQHMETILFKEKFLDWPDYTRVVKVKHQESKSNSVEITPCDAEKMWNNQYEDPDLVLEGSHVGRGTHYYDKNSMRHYDIKTKSVCKWIIQEYDFQKVENEAELGDFFSGDSYVLRWEYQINVSARELNGKPSKHNVTGRDRCAYFCWQGKDASPNEKGAAAFLTVELDKEKGPQIRVAQGSEPPAFLNLFQGNLTMHQGKKDLDKNRWKLFVTRGNLSNEAYLLQVPCSVRQLRSRGSLLLVDTEKGSLYIWHGARSLKHTKNIAIELANKLIARKSGYLFGNNASAVNIMEVKEGEESKEVLEALGVANKQYYNSVLSGGKDAGSDLTPRLFHLSDLGGQFEAVEMLSPLRHEHLVTPFPFEQKELYSASQPALFIVDDGVSVWLWQGWWPRGEDGELEPAEVNSGVGAFAFRWQSLRAAALRTAEAYWRVSRSSRPEVKVVVAGLEPDAFTHLFDTWAEHDDAAEANIAHGYKAGEVVSGACELSRLTNIDAILPLAALQRRPLPDHVDPHHLERHLSSPDFLEAFGITKEEFAVLPAWKQTNLKKDVGLF